MHLLVVLAACSSAPTAPDTSFQPTSTGYQAEAPGLHASLSGHHATVTVEEGRISFVLTAVGRADAAEAVPHGPLLCEDPDCSELTTRTGSVETWWKQLDDQQLEVGWTVPTRPAGDGPLTLDLLVEGADAAPQLGGKSAVLGPVRLSRLAAWDATGRDLDVGFRGVEGGLGIHVDDAGAAYPITIDPVVSPAHQVLTSPDGNIWENGHNHTWGGWGGKTIRNIGDLPWDGDGYPELLITDPDSTGGAEGRAYIYRTGPTGIITPHYLRIARTGNAFGSDAVAGDFNCDGWTDIAVGAPYDGTNYNGGAVHIYYGRSQLSQFPTTPDLSWYGPEQEAVGWRLEAGNFDGGASLCHDLIVAGGGAGGINGQVRRWIGNPAGLNVAGPDGALNVGYIRRGQDMDTGDLDGDGFDDLVVMSFESSCCESLGHYYVFRGSATGLPTSSSARLDAAGAGFPGLGVRIVDDVSGDGVKDLVAKSNKGCCGASGSSAYTFDGANFTEITATRREGIDNLGHSVISADIDGDGTNDLVVGSWNNTKDLPIHILYNGAAAFDSAYDEQVLVSGIGDHYLEPLGDFDGDGYDDFVAGSFFDGQIRVYRGGEADLDQDGFGASRDCNDNNPAVNPATPDFCGNGIDDDCDGVIDDGTYWLDDDNDGYGDPATQTTGCAAGPTFVTNGDDCDDTDINNHPGVPELCDGLDNNCDGQIDEAPSNPSTFYADTDGDGFGDPNVPIVECNLPSGASVDNTDCDDTDPDIFPGAVEQCDGLDRDCSGTIDDNVTPGLLLTWYWDDDGDGWGDPNGATELGCSPSSAQYAQSGDCDDTNANVYPGKPEDCNGIDDDCDGIIDADAVVGVNWYADQDGDGHGNPAVSTFTCVPPSGFVNLGDDCDDTNGSAYPGATEIPGNGVDEDCDGEEHCYRDFDEDGFRGSDLQTTPTTVIGCDQPPWATASTPANDCNDANPNIYFGALEVCNGTDDDCDTLLDENASVTTSFLDNDGDGYGDPAQSALRCPGSNYVAQAGDCNDADNTIHPGAVELCDGIDQDCDTIADDNALGAPVWYFDGDGDGWGTASFSLQDCVQPNGFGATTGDCNDSDPNTYPGATEVPGDEVDQSCDGEELCFEDFDQDGARSTNARPSPDTTCQAQGEAPVSAEIDCDDLDGGRFPGNVEICNDVDDDCDGTIDNVTTPPTWYQDLDGDGFGNDSINQVTCTPPTNHVLMGGDCDDTDANVITAVTWYADVDQDGYGGTAEVEACTAPAGFVAITGDCDDDDATILPGATETAADGIDSDCDGAEQCYADTDGDGFRTDQLITGAATDCTGPLEALATDPNGDCADLDETINPGRPELCNGLDDNCSGTADDVVGLQMYADSDGDGYGDASSTTSCAPGTSGWVWNSTDCDDTAASINPGAAEACNGLDDNCNGAVDDGVLPVPWHPDLDGDGFGTPAAQVVTCTPPTGFVADHSDCDDGNPGVYPGAVDAPGDGVDGDCDGDEQCYADLDGDGHRTDQLILGATIDCSGGLEALATAPAGDCNDFDAAINPAAPEVCNGLDDNCDGNADDGNAATVYPDADGDGYGDPAGAQACSTGTGFVDNDLDCDDTDAAINLAPSWFPDADGDGHGAVVAPVVQCTAPPSHVDSADDCDDTRADRAPSNTENPGDGIDGDCDGTELCYVDADGDGFFGSTTTVGDLACTGLGDTVDDCDDTDAAVNPDARDLLNGFDDNCNGATDESSDQLDRDGDGYCADPNFCETVDGVTPIPGDCNDNNIAISPTACEVDDGRDNNCDGDVDEIDTRRGCRDQDSDGFESPVDCNDYDANVHPDARERCNGLDDNCDGIVPANETDVDRDNWRACEDDCDDHDPKIHPYAVEDCTDGIDNDCDGTTDQDGNDTDGDGYTVCQGDCGEGDPLIRPGARERNNDLDDDCDGRIDEGLDRDGDQWDACTGDQEPCDCDDTDPNIRPFAAEICGNSIDENCNPADDNADAERDDDNDGVPVCDGDCDDADPLRNPLLSEQCNGIDDNCNGTVDERLDRDGDFTLPCMGDCEDDIFGIYPGAREACDGEDNDCDGEIDDEFEDADGDGYLNCDGDIAVDCDDTDPNVNPDPKTTEVCGNQIDDDCNGVIDWNDVACDPADWPGRWFCGALPGANGFWPVLALMALLRRRGGAR